MRSQIAKKIEGEGGFMNFKNKCIYSKKLTGRIGEDIVMSGPNEWFSNELGCREEKANDEEAANPRVGREAWLKKKNIIT